MLLQLQGAVKFSPRLRPTGPSVEVFEMSTRL
jgi:hypothetical protein